MQKKENGVIQIEYIIKLGTLVNLLGDSLKYLQLEREITDLHLFVSTIKAIEAEFAKLDPEIFKQPLAGELYDHIKSCHQLFKEMLDNFGKMTDCIEAFFRTGNEEELLRLASGEFFDIYTEQSRKMIKQVDNLNTAYARLNKKFSRLVRR